MKDIRIATVSSNSPVGKMDYNLDCMRVWIQHAKNQGVEIICFPEMNTCGYATNRDTVVMLSEPIPGKITDDLLKIAGHYNIVILAGITEIDKEGRIFATHLVVEPGRIAGMYRKLHLAPPESTVLTPGNQIPLFESCGIKFGIQLCYDAHFPELSTNMAVGGADLIFFPHASPRGTPNEKYVSWMRHLTARAFDNSVFIVACNQSGENKNGLFFPGISVIIGPNGEVICKDISGEENMLVADLKNADLLKVREHRMRYFLPNRRPELYYKA